VSRVRLLAAEGDGGPGPGGDPAGPGRDQVGQQHRPHNPDQERGAGNHRFRAQTDAVDQQAPGPASEGDTERHPHARATTATVVACQATAADTCERTNPNVLRTARSRRRCRIEVTSRWASAEAANRASRPASTSGRPPTRPRFWTSVGGQGTWTSCSAPAPRPAAGGFAGRRRGRRRARSARRRPHSPRPDPGRGACQLSSARRGTAAPP